MSESYIEVNGINHWVKMRIINEMSMPVVIVHGGPGGFTNVYEKIPGIHLERYLNIIYYEQRGCGRTEEPTNGKYDIESLIDDLKKLISKLGYKKVHLLGYSFGAELAAEFTLSHPEMVGKLVLHSPSDMADSQRLYRIQYEGIKSVLRKEKLHKLVEINNSKRSVIEKYNRIWSLMDSESSDKLLFHNQDRARWNREQWESSTSINTGKMAREVIGRVRECTVCESAKSISKETLVIIGKHDKNVGIEIPKDYATNIKKSKLVVFENSGHFPDIEECEKYVFEIVQFLK